MLKLNRFILPASEVLLWASIIFLTTSRSWLTENFELNVDYLIYLNFFLLLIIKILPITKYIKYLINNNFKILDTYIYLSLLFFLIWHYSANNINSNLLGFLAIYMLLRASMLFPSNQRSSQNILSGLCTCAFITIFGIFSGVIEYLFFESTYLYEIKETPSPIKVFPVFFGGFQESYNQSAYIIMGALSFVGFLNFSKKLELFYSFFCWVALFLTGAKVVFLFLAVALIVKFLSSKNIILTKFFISVVSLGYIFFSHILVIESGEIVYADKYFKEIVMQFNGIDFYLSLFSWLKIESWNYFLNNYEVGMSLTGFQNFTQGYEPHFLFASLVFMGGTLFTTFVYLRIIKSTYLNFNYGLNNQIYFSTLAIVFFCEIIIWDSQNSIVFWIVILYLVSNENFKDKIEKI